MSSIRQLLQGNSLHKSILEKAGKLAQKHSMPSYVVGGFVRDSLLGKQTNDIDIMVEGDGVQFAKYLAAELNIPVTVDYDRFGTALIPHPDVEIEIASG